MTLNVELVLALLVAVPCLIVLVKATDAKARIFPALGLATAALALFAPVIHSQIGSLDIGRYAWIATGITALVAGLRAAHPVYTTLMITGGVLGALIELRIVAH